MDLKIVEYEDKYADSLADMWNRSAENWGGYNELKTEEDIVRAHANTANLNNYLALDDEEVIGYCSISDDWDEEDSLYIAMLNVRPDYIGKKVGKALVLKAVNRAIELELPCISLYTWPGNTKAVPLYKKCGFFWEKKDGSTHLLNFIPTVLNTEALREHFEEIDWYNDSQRKIEIKPDGREEDNFRFFEYRWEKDGKNLKCGFERRGKGLRLIETDNYVIKVYLDDYKTIFEKKYRVHYIIKNKTGRKLEVELKGQNDKIIRYDFNKSLSVQEEKEISAEFFVNPIPPGQRKKGQTPSVTTEVKINGKKALFKLGIIPQPPAEINLITMRKENFLEKKQTCFIEVKNCYKESAEFTINLPENNDNISFLKDKIKIDLPSEGKKTIKMTYILHKFFVFSADIDILAKTKDSHSTFKHRFNQLFKGTRGIFGGEIDLGWVICNGRYSVRLNRNNNTITVNNFKIGSMLTKITFPRIGKPFSLEFSNKEPENVTRDIKDEKIIMTAHYQSGDFPGIELKSITVLENNGIVKHHYELFNNTHRKTSREIFLADCFSQPLEQGIIPYNGKALKIKNQENNYLQVFDLDQISENWLFSNDTNCTRGIIWPSDHNITLSEWTSSIKYNFGQLTEGTKVTTKPIILAIDIFSRWDNFRSFALKEQSPCPLEEINEFDIEFNHNNPIIYPGQKIPVIYRDLTKANLKGKLEIKSEKDSFSPIIKDIKRQKDIILGRTKFTINKPNTCEIINLNLDLNSHQFNRKLLALSAGKNDISTSIISEKGHEVYKLDNGILTLKAAPNFSHSLYSLTYKDEEWLDSSFPSPKPKAWWNPWVGGIFVQPPINDMQLINEKRKIEFAEMKDNYRNHWSGIKMVINITKNKMYRGISYSHYFLTLPKLPLVLSLMDIKQNTGKYFKGTPFNTQLFLKPGREIKNKWFITREENEELLKYKTGEVNHNIKTKSPILFGSQERKKNLLIYKPGQNFQWSRTDNKTLQISLKDRITAESDAEITTDPVYLLFTDSYYNKSILSNLTNLSFS